ncbi:hypothetical protein DENIT_10532 [Pseudomonas veronii]|nr:hypothetical protein DENIT_10532 [Pseudomonas veronii]
MTWLFRVPKGVERKEVSAYAERRASYTGPSLSVQQTEKSRTLVRESPAKFFTCIAKFRTCPGKAL